ncbi:MAG TPA: ASCH domain-containing protein [Trichocoleus sp.]
MRILTLWQPWASLIAAGLKRCETRSWRTDYRGPLVIHAAKRPMKYPDMATWIEAVILAEEAEKFDDQSIVPLVSELPYGAVVAIADLAGCFKMVHATDASAVGKNEILIGQQSVLERAVGDWSAGRFAWQLENIKALEPILWKGGQGLRDVLPELKDLVLAQVGAQSDE